MIMGSISDESASTASSTSAREVGHLPSIRIERAGLLADRSTSADMLERHWRSASPP